MGQFMALAELEKSNESFGCCMVILGAFRSRGFRVEGQDGREKEICGSQLAI